MSTLILIPARMASNRLAGKPLADIAGAPDTQSMAEAVRADGFEAVVTRTDHARERLEPLRALQASMRMDVEIVPLGLDTPHDLERARSILST